MHQSQANILCDNDSSTLAKVSGQSSTLNEIDNNIEHFDNDATKKFYTSSQIKRDYKFLRGSLKTVKNKITLNPLTLLNESSSKTAVSNKPRSAEKQITNNGTLMFYNTCDKFIYENSSNANNMTLIKSKSITSCLNAVVDTKKSIDDLPAAGEEQFLLNVNRINSISYANKDERGLSVRDSSDSDNDREHRKIEQKSDGLSGRATISASNKTRNIDTHRFSIDKANCKNHDLISFSVTTVVPDKQKTSDAYSFSSDENKEIVSSKIEEKSLSKLKKNYIEEKLLNVSQERTMNSGEKFKQFDEKEASEGLNKNRSFYVLKSDIPKCSFHRRDYNQPFGLETNQVENCNSRQGIKLSKWTKKSSSLFSCPNTKGILKPLLKNGKSQYNITTAAKSCVSSDYDGFHSVGSKNEKTATNSLTFITAPKKVTEYSSLKQQKRIQNRRFSQPIPEYAIPNPDNDSESFLLVNPFATTSMELRQLSATYNGRSTHQDYLEHFQQQMLAHEDDMICSNNFTFRTRSTKKTFSRHNGNYLENCNLYKKHPPSQSVTPVGQPQRVSVSKSKTLKGDFVLEYEC